MKLLQILACAVASVNASTGSTGLGEEFDTENAHPKTPWNYHQNGALWGAKETKNVAGKVIKNYCGDETIPQSPIDLKNSWPKKSNILDRFSKVYTDQTFNSPTKTKKNQIEVSWNGHTSQVPVDREGQDIQSFYSNNANETYGSAKRYNGVQFHFHAGSEHTVEGKRHDLEMHTVHMPWDGKQQVNTGVKGFVASAMGIMFSVDDASSNVEDWQVQIIDKFFDELKWEDKTDTEATPLFVPKVSYGELMMMLDMQNRWTYRGSVTTPPCAVAVYWNVLRTVYPIKAKHLALFKAQLAREPGLDKQGNWRVIQKYVDGKQGTVGLIIESGSSNVGMLVAVIILAVLVFVLLLVVMKLRMNLKSGLATGKNEMQVLPETSQYQSEQQKE